jgi:hypothetical protein
MEIIASTNIRHFLVSPIQTGLAWIVTQSMSENNPGSSQIFCSFKPGLDWIPMIWIFFLLWDELD